MTRTIPLVSLREMKNYISNLKNEYGETFKPPDYRRLSSDEEFWARGLSEVIRQNYNDCLRDFILYYI